MTCRHCEEPGENMINLCRCGNYTVHHQCLNQWIKEHNKCDSCNGTINYQLNGKNCGSDFLIHIGLGLLNLFIIFGFAGYDKILYQHNNSLEIFRVVALAFPVSILCVFLIFAVTHLTMSSLIRGIHHTFNEIAENWNRKYLYYFTFFHRYISRSISICLTLLRFFSLKHHFYYRKNNKYTY